MKKEYSLIFVVGLFLLGYLLDSVVNPLNISLSTPYHYFNPQYLTKYPFTTVSIFVKALGLFVTPLWVLSFLERKYTLKASILLILGVLMQLYALQDIVTDSKIVPIEWSLSISLAGGVLLVPMIMFFVMGLFVKDRTTQTLQEEKAEGDSILLP